MDDSAGHVSIGIVGTSDVFHPDQTSSAAQSVVFDWVVRKGQVLSREGGCCNEQYLIYTDFLNPSVFLLRFGEIVLNGNRGEV